MRLRRLGSELARILGEEGGFGSDFLSKGLGILPSQPSKAAELVKELLSDEEALSRCASQSYSHANGFDKIVLLVGDRPSFKLRLHIWNSDAGMGGLESHLHNHRWSFASRVLVGEYIFEAFVPRSNANVYHAYEYVPRDSPGSYALFPQGVTELGSALCFSVTRGVSYFMDYATIHRVNAIKPTISMVLQGPPMTEVSSVFSRLPLSSEPQDHLIPVMCVETLVVKLRAAIALLSS
jgi:hypothetical protein